MASGLPVIFLSCAALTLILNINRFLLGVSAVGCFGGLTDCARPSTSGSDPLGDTYELIDKHLVSAVPNDELEPNMSELKELLRLENEDESNRSSRFFANRKRAMPLSQQLPTKDREMMKSTLRLLLRLEYVVTHHGRCLVSNTHNLRENNRFAKDPIGKRIREEPDDYPRIGALIFNSAVQRAQICLPQYKEELTRMTILPLYPVSDVCKYWDRIIEHRMEVANFIHARDTGVNRLDRAFIKRPKESMLFVMGMQTAIEPEELEIYASVFSNNSTAPAGRAYINSYAGFNDRVLQPCRDYHNQIRGIYNSMDFDLKLRRFVPPEIVRMTAFDDIVSRLRSYLYMCRKLLDENSKIIDLFHLRSQEAQATDDRESNQTNK